SSLRRRWLSLRRVSASALIHKTSTERLRRVSRRTTVAIDHDVYIVKLLRELRRAGRSTVLCYRDESLSGEALLALIFQYARVLRDLGIRRGNLLGMFAPNRPEAIAVRYAAHVLG